MKQPAILAAAVLIAVGALTAGGQQPAVPAAPALNQQELATLVDEITAQQVKIAANQKAIDEKLATVAEALRVAKIYVSRGGAIRK